MALASRTYEIGLCLILITFTYSFDVMIDYCRNNTFDQPTEAEKLHFSKENSDEEFGIYDKFKCLHCCSHGYQSIEWFKNGYPYPWSTDVSTLIINSESRNQTIYSQKLAYGDSGKYWCVAKNETHFLRHEVHLEVSGPHISMEWPKTTYRLRNQSAAVGESVRFYCEAFVGTIDLPDFRSEIIWKKQGTLSSFINGARIIQKNIFREEKRVIGSYLIFSFVKVEDYGKYTCKVKNFGDQIIEVSAWLIERKLETKNDGTVLLLVLTATAIFITFLLHFGPRFKVIKKETFKSSTSPDEGKKDLLIIYHEYGGGDALINLLKPRYRFSSSLYPITDKSQIGGDDLKAKANSFKGLLVVMTPELVGGFWSYQSVRSTIQSLVKIHFTVICLFEQGLPDVDETHRKLLNDALGKVYCVEGSSATNLQIANCLKRILHDGNGDDSESNSNVQESILI